MKETYASTHTVCRFERPWAPPESHRVICFQAFCQQNNTFLKNPKMKETYNSAHTVCWFERPWAPPESHRVICFQAFCAKKNTYLKNLKMKEIYDRTHTGCQFEWPWAPPESHRVIGFQAFCAKKNTFLKNLKMKETYNRTHTRTRLGAAKRGLWDGQKSEFPIQNLIFLVAPKATQLPTTRSTPIPVSNPIGLTWRIFRG